MPKRIKRRAPKIALIGVGHLGLALSKCWIHAGLVKASDLLLFERDRARRRKVSSELKLRNQSKALEAVSTADLVVFAVKPQDFVTAAKQLAPFLHPAQVVLSVMAGVPMASIGKALPRIKKIARAMPNLPVSIRQGTTVFTCSKRVGPSERALVSDLLQCTGLALYVPQERTINFANAISGCGPGYIFYLYEQLERQSKSLGFKPADLKSIVAQTVIGSTLLWLSGQESAQQLKLSVASKKGTTQAALDLFESQRLSENLVEGIFLALKRANQISSELQAQLN